MKMKTHKAFAKRMKVTGTGKLLKRYAGQDHFNSRDSGKITRKKRRDKDASDAISKAAKTFMPYKK